MPKATGSTTKGQKKFTARTPKARENYLINLAMNLAEEKLKNGTATSQLICHFLTLATTKEQLSNEKLRSDLDVANAKIKQMEAQENRAEMYDKVLEAMRSYTGTPVEEEEFDD